MAFGVALALATSSILLRTHQPQSLADPLMQMAARYVADYGPKGSFIVGVERSTQHYSPARLGEPSARRLVAEFALVKTHDAVGWIGYRDVIEVDGKRVSDRSDRLQRLFSRGTPDASETRRIADESARFNIGIRRNFNTPTTALFFFVPANLARFTFTRGEETTIDDVHVVQIDFKEVARPTLIRTSAGRDVASHGSLWVTPSDGTVVRTRLVVTGFGGMNSSAEIDVRYAHDARLDMWLPATMTERYTASMRSQGNLFLHAVTSMGEATATATYGDFKRFETSSTISIK